MKWETSHNKEIGEIFDQVASRYDRVGPAIFSYFGKLLVEMAGIHQGARVLDAGAGVGAILFPAARKTGARGCATGIDISQGMIRKTAVRIKRSGLENIHILRMDAQHLSFAKCIFDYVLSGFSIFFCSMPLQALHEFNRVLVKEGVLGITSRALDTETQWMGDLLRKFAPADALQGKRIDGAHRSPNWHTPAGIEEAMVAAGFTDIRVTVERAHFTYENKEQWWVAQWANGLRRSLSAIHPASLESFKREAFKLLEDYKKNGGIRMPFQAIAAFGVKKRGHSRAQH